MSTNSNAMQRLVVGAFAIAFLAGPTAALAQETDADSVKLSWMANDPDQTVKGYEIHYALQSGPPYEGVFADQGPSPIRIPVDTLEDPANPKFRLSGIPPCATIFLSIKAYNDAGESDFAEEISATVAHTPAHVRAFGVSDSQVHVSWEAPPPEYVEKITRYLVYYEMTPIPMLAVDSGYRYMIEVLPNQVDATSPNVLLEGLQPEMYVNIAVAATCASGENDLSKPATTQTAKKGETVDLPDDLDIDDGPLTGGCAVASSPDASWALLLLLGALLIRRRR